jgi:hypothetical protein
VILEDCPITIVLSEVMCSGGVGGPLIQQPVSFDRNLTNNP